MRKKMIRESLVALGLVLMMTGGAAAQESVETEMPGTEVPAQDLTSVEENYINSDGEIVGEGESDWIVRTETNADGLVLSRWFFDTEGNSIIFPGAGYAGITFEYDDQGLVCKERYFGTDGERIALENGASGYDAVNLSENTKLEQLWLDVNDEPVVNEAAGFAHVVRETDEAGNIVKVSFYDENEKPLTQKAGYAVVEREYDDQQHKTLERYLDEEGNLVEIPSTGYAAITYEYDENGLVSAERYYGADGERILLANGTSGYTAVNLNKSTKLEQIWIGTEDEPVFNEDAGFARVEREQDEDGNIARVSFYDENGDLAVQSKGYAVVLREYDDQHRKTKESYLGGDGNPVRLPGAGYAGMGYEYDENGNITAETYYGENGEIIQVGGYATVRREYDDKGRVVKESYYNQNGEPRIFPGAGYAGIVYEYDDADNITRETYYGVDGQMTASVNGYASIAREYDDWGQVTKESYFDKYGEPSILPGAGYSSITYEYDSMGLVNFERYYGKDGNRITLSNGVSGYSTINLNDKIKLEEMFVDENDQPVMNSRTGYAYVVRDIDEDGRVYYVAFYDENLDPIETEQGYAFVSRDYNESGKVIMESYFDINGDLTILPGAGYAAVTYEYDDQGLVSAERYFGVDGTRTLLSNGVSGYKAVNYNRKIKLEELWLDIDETPAMNLKLGYARVQRELDEDGNILRESYYDASNKPVTIEDGYATIVRKYNEDHQVVRESYFGEDGKAMLLPSTGYAAVTYEYDDRGYVCCERYFDKAGKRITLSDGSSGYRVNYLNENVKLEEMWLDENDEPVINLKEGCAHIIRDADESGLVYHVAYFDEFDDPIRLSSGYAAVSREYDENGKKIRESYYDEDNEPIKLPSKGYASIAYEYDDMGLVCAERYFGEDGRRIALGNDISGFTCVNLNKSVKLEQQFIGVKDRPVINKDLGYSHVVREADADGNITRISFFDQEDHPIMVKEGYASVEREFNEIQQMTKESYFGRTGQAILRPGVGYASVEYTYDRQGLVSGERYYGTNGRPITLSSGVAGCDIVNLDEEVRLKEQWLDEDGNPAYNMEKGYARVERESDPHGNIVKVSFYDENDNLEAQREGYAVLTREYDAAGRKIRESYFDALELPVLLRSGGYASITYEYDVQGIVSCERYFGTGGDRIVLENGVSGYRALNLNKDIKLDEMWLDENDQPVMNKEAGYAHIVRAVDGLGNVTQVSYFDEKYQPVMVNEGYASVKMKYNRRRQKTSESYFNEDGQGVVAAGLGYATVKYEYDKKGRVCGERYFWMDGRPIVLTNGVAGYRCVYSNDDVKLEEMWVDRSGTPVMNSDLGYASVVREVDGMGDVLRVSYYDQNGDPIAVRNGYAVVEREYNVLRQKTEERYLGTDGSGVLSKSAGYASVKYTYDDLGLVSSERYYGTDGRRITLQNGISGYEAVYLDKKQKLDELYLDEEDHPVMNTKTGYAHVVREADKAGNIVSVTFYDENDQTISAGGFANVKREYDEGGNLAKESYFNALGEPTPMGDGYYQIGFTYDSLGRKLTERYYDKNGNLMLTQKGYAGVNRTYDKAGNIIREAYVGVDEEYRMTDAGYAIVVRLYDPDGNKTEEAYFNANGYPVYPYERGYARATYVYDNEGHVIKAEYFDRMNERRDMGGYSGYKAAYSNGKRVMDAYLNEYDALSVNKARGFALAYHDYDAAGNEIATRYYDERRLPVEVGGAAVTLRSFDAAGNVTSEKKFNANGLLILASKGCAWIEKEYNEDGKVTRETYMDAAGKPMNIGGYASVQRIYNDEGHAVMVSYYDENGQSAVLPKGYSAIRRGSSDEGKIVQTEYLGADGEPVMISDGYSMTISEFDEAGNTIFEKWYDTEGNQINRKDKSYAAVVREYNDQKKPVRSTYVDLNDQRVDNEDGYAIVVNQYDERGNKIYEAYFTKEGFQVMPVGKWYHVVKREYDEKNNLVLERYYGFYDDPITVDAGYAGISMEYNEEGKEVRRRLLDADGNLATAKGGYSQTTTEYPDKNTVLITYYDAYGNEVKTTSGYSRYEKITDDQGRTVRTAYYNPGGVPAPIGSKQYVRVDYVYSDDGKVTKEYRDVNGNVVRVEET